MQYQTKIFPAIMIFRKDKKSVSARIEIDVVFDIKELSEQDFPVAFRVIRSDYNAKSPIVTDLRYDGTCLYEPVHPNLLYPAHFDYSPYIESGIAGKVAPNGGIFWYTPGPNNPYLSITDNGEPIQISDIIDVSIDYEAYMKRGYAYYSQFVMFGGVVWRKTEKEPCYKVYDGKTYVFVDIDQAYPGMPNDGMYFRADQYGEAVALARKISNKNIDCRLYVCKPNTGIEVFIPEALKLDPQLEYFTFRVDAGTRWVADTVNAARNRLQGVFETCSLPYTLELENELLLLDADEMQKRFFEMIKDKEKVPEPELEGQQETAPDDGEEAINGTENKS